jgi:ankyrin repeat protein
MKTWTLSLLLLSTVGVLRAGSREDDLLTAVRNGDAAAVKALLDQGVAVDTKFRYDRTALSFAADRGNTEMVKLLLERGADADAEDTFYGNTALGWAAYKGHVDVVKLLVARSPKKIGSALVAGVSANKPDVVEAVVASGKVSTRDLSYALQTAEKREAPDVAERLRRLGAVPPPRADASVDAATLARYAGRYRQEGGSEEFTLGVADGALQATFGGRASKLGAIDAQRFQQLEAAGVTLAMRLEGDRVVGATVTEIGSERSYRRVEEAKP